MNHKWELVKSDNKYIKKHECTVCGCTRQTQTVKDGGYFRQMVDYMRSGIIFGSQRPECIDWNDNSKTID